MTLKPNNWIYRQRIEEMVVKSKQQNHKWRYRVRNVSGNPLGECLVPIRFNAVNVIFALKNMGLVNRRAHFLSYLVCVSDGKINVYHSKKGQKLLLLWKLERI